MRRAAPVLLLGALLLLAGCATTGGPPPGPAGVTAAKHEHKGAADAAIPAVELTGPLLFRLLTAEFAMLGQDYHLAAQLYLESAELTRDPRLAEQAARIALLARYDEIARSAASLWVELSPDNLYAQEAVVSAYVRNGEVDAVQPYLDRLLGADQDEELGFRLASMLLGHQGEVKTALRALEMFVARHPDNFTAWYVYGYLALRGNELPLAADATERALELRPDVVAVQQIYLEVLKKQGRYAEASAYLERAIARRPRDADLHLTYARLLLEMLRVDEAKREFQLALKYDPDNRDVLFALSLLALQERRPDAAHGYLKRLERLGDERNRVHYFLGQAEEMRGATDAAISYYLRVGEGDEYLEAQVRVAVLQARRGEMAAAQDRIHTLMLRFHDRKKDLIQVEAELLYEAGMMQASIEVLDRALEEFRDDRDLLFARALAAERLDRLDEVERDLKKILAMDPGNVNALNALGFVLADKTDRYQEAYGYIKQALELSPNDAGITDSMGWVLYRLGDLEGAEQYLRRALSMSRDHEIAAHLGEVLWMLGKHDEARRVWNEALEQAPEDTLLRDVMKRFGQLH